MEPTSLYRLAALPDDTAAKLTPDTLLTDPQTGRSAPLKTLSARSLDRALDALEGKAVPPRKPKAASVDVALSGDTREAVAADARRIMGQLANELSDIGQLQSSRQYHPTDSGTVGRKRRKGVWKSMTIEEAKQAIQNDTASFSAWVTAAGVLTSSHESSLDDLLSCLNRRGLPAEMAATALYVRTGRARKCDTIESFVTDYADWADYLRKTRPK